MKPSSRFSCYRDNISIDVRLSVGTAGSAWLPDRTASRLASRPGQSVSHSKLWMYSVEAIDTIVL